MLNIYYDKKILLSTRFLIKACQLESLLNAFLAKLCFNYFLIRKNILFKCSTIRDWRKL